MKLFARRKAQRKLLALAALVVKQDRAVNLLKGNAR